MRLGEHASLHVRCLEASDRASSHAANPVPRSIDGASIHPCYNLVTSGCWKYAMGRIHHCQCGNVRFCEASDGRTARGRAPRPGLRPDRACAQKSAYTLSSGYQLTRQATDLLTVVRVLRNPKPLLLADKTLPIVEQSVYTLLHSLFGAGWKLLRKRPKDDLPLLNITVGPVLPANRWIRLSPDASHVGRPYLQCLAKLDQSSSFRGYLRDNGVYCIQHGQSDKFYEALVSENPARLLKVDFEADASVPEARSLRDTCATAVAGQSKTGKFKLQESFRWGAVSFKYHQPPKGSEHGSVQCDCVRKSHRRQNAKGQTIPCTWTCKFTTEEERVALVRRMKHWVVLGFDCHSHRSHQALHSA